MSKEYLILLTFHEGTGQVAFYRDQYIIESLAEPKESYAIVEWLATQPGEVITPSHYWEASIDIIKKLAATKKIRPGDYFTCTCGDDLLWAFVYSTVDAIKTFDIKDTVPAFSIYEDTTDLVVECTLKPEEVYEI